MAIGSRLPIMHLKYMYEDVIYAEYVLTSFLYLLNISLHQKNVV